MKIKNRLDDSVPKDILQRYQQWLSEIHHIKEISISRWFSIDVGKKSDIELNIYSDPSNSAYVVVAYFKSITSNKSVFVLSKSRLSPIKEKALTTPSLELHATVIAVKLESRLLKILDI